MLVRNSQIKEPIAMNVPCATVSRILRAVLLVAATVHVARADESQKAKPPAPNPLQAPVQVPFAIELRREVSDGKVGRGIGTLTLGDQPQEQAGGNANASGLAPTKNGPKQPHLGVVFDALSPAVRAQLDLPEGVGLLVDFVAMESPAAKAGVKKFDVIRAFNDQVIVSGEQLKKLIKLAGAGKKVTLTIVRGGREKVVEAVLEERDANADVIMERGEGTFTLSPVEEGVGFEHPVFFKVQVNSAGGKKTVIVKDFREQPLYTGPLDTEEDFKKVPEEYRAWVRTYAAGKEGQR
jgi:hypothetical protein